jgi:glycosyltransferase involved in cell wall biosynthesis
MMTSNDSSAAQPKTPSIIVFRDKLLLPSEGFIKTHYTAFDAANLVYVASHFGWRAAELDGQMMATAPDSLRRFWFKKTGRTSILPDLKALAPRSVHAHFGRGGALALPLAEALGVPLFVTFHGGDATKETHQRRRLIPTIYQRRLSHLQAYASGFLCVSQFVADRLVAQGFPKAKLITHYIGIDVSGMQQPEQRQGRLLFIGRFVDKKGVDVLLAAMRRLHQSDSKTVPGLDIAGSGPLEAELRAQAADLPSVRCLGWQTPEQLSRILHKAQAVVVPSRIAADGDCEGLPTVVLESIRAGVPVVASDHAGIPEIIRHEETGFLVPENDPDALAAALVAASQTGDQMRQMVARAQQRLQRDFNAATQSQKLQQYLLGNVTADAAASDYSVM